MRQTFSIAFIALFVAFSNKLCGQSISTERVLTFNFINPGIDFETRIGQKSTFSINAGVGYGTSYPELSRTGTGFLYIISPFLDIQTRKYYNLNKRNDLGKNTKMNSGNFFGLRLLSRGQDFNGNFERDNNLDFAFGPTWGLKRTYNRINLLFDIGPIIYWDKDNTGFFPLTFEINIGYILNKK